MFKNLFNRGSAIIILIFILAVALVFVFYSQGNENFNFQSLKLIRNALQNKNSAVEIKKFESEQDFKNYLEKNNSDSQYSKYGSSLGMRNMAIMEDAVMIKEIASPIMAQGLGEASGMELGNEASRISETNTQVLSIDEPDIVKTDGENIFYSHSKYYYGYRNQGSYYNRNAETKIIKAFPPAKLAEIADIEQAGDLFLSEDTLIIFSGKNIYAYDISDPEEPREKWKIELEDNSYLIEARLYKGDIYLVTRNYINQNTPCPIRPLSTGGVDFEVKCGDIYYPNVPLEVDSTFVAWKIDSQSGEIKDQTSFVGSANSSITYMSENALYITYFYNKDSLDFFSNFLSEKCSDLVSTELISKLNLLRSYDISGQAKMIEMQVLLEKFYNGLTNDERLKIQNEFTNRMNEYHQEHIRDLEKTGIVKIDLDNLKVKANGEVPGYPLNQFSLDEYQGNLRIATTIGERTGSMYWVSRGDSLNDVYVLDKDLKIKGSVQNLGETERVYSVRFVGDMGYVVTYRQIDPFYVLDLSQPSNPELKGELKIPGYSSYLHPITDDIILGIGKEGSKVKLSLFDVTDPSDPQEVSKYMLDEYWSEAVDNHHAFLLDQKHGIFFIPGGKGAYIFSYVDNKLSLTKALSKTGIQRAIYLDDYLYIIGSEEISVINENDWTEVNNMNFDGFNNNPDLPVLEEETRIQKIEVFAE
jgi:inhibitor of cysteine peptidase